MSFSEKLVGKTAIVTGAAQGIGRGIALRLARDGASVVLTDLKKDKLEAVAAEIEALGAKRLSRPLISASATRSLPSCRKPGRRLAMSIS